MADNVPITAGSGTTIATEERSIASTNVQVQRVTELGSLSIFTSQVTPTTTAATLIAARETRKRLVLVNNGSCDCWIGPATVTTSNGFLLAAGYSVTILSTALVQAILASGATMTGVVSILEEGDA